MTWLEILNVLEEMPMHLLKQDAELWHYDDKGDYDVLPIDDIVSPLSDDEDRDDPEWKKGGAYGLSLQSFDDEREPKRETFVIDVTTMLGKTFTIEADSMEDAWEKAKKLVNNRKFFDEHLHALDNEWDSTDIENVVGGWDRHGKEDFIAPEIVDKYLNEEE